MGIEAMQTFVVAKEQQEPLPVQTTRDLKIGLKTKSTPFAMGAR